MLLAFLVAERIAQLRDDHRALLAARAAGRPIRDADERPVRVAVYSESRRTLEHLGHYLYLRFGDDAVAQCRGLLAFLGYRANLGVLCDAAVSLNSRATMAEVMGLARRDGPRARRARDGPVAARVVHHGVRTLDDPIAAALSVRQAANLTQRFWPRLPPLLQSKWRGALREYLEYVL